MSLNVNPAPTHFVISSTVAICNALVSVNCSNAPYLVESCLYKWRLTLVFSDMASAGQLLLRRYRMELNTIFIFQSQTGNLSFILKSFENSSNISVFKCIILPLFCLRHIYVHILLYLELLYGSRTVWLFQILVMGCNYK